MTLTFSAVVEKDGRLRPINCVPLPEGTEVAVTVEVEQKPPTARRPAEVLAEIAALPLQGTPDPNASVEHDRAVFLGEQFFAEAICNVVRLEEQDIRESWGVFRHCADKQWSFTVSSSSVLMRRLGVRMAFTFDHHFRQFGTVLVMP